MPCLAGYTIGQKDQCWLLHKWVLCYPLFQTRVGMSNPGSLGHLFRLDALKIEYRALSFLDKMD